jgi:hypothetical protein
VTDEDFLPDSDVELSMLNITIPFGGYFWIGGTLVRLQKHSSNQVAVTLTGPKSVQIKRVPPEMMLDHKLSEHLRKYNRKRNVIRRARKVDEVASTQETSVSPEASLD